MNEPKITIDKRHVTIRFTHEQARQMHSCLNAANLDGDHHDWTKGAGATPSQLRALSAVMRAAARISAVIGDGR